MRRSELKRQLGSGRAHACVVDLREVEDCPGYVRTVTVLQGNRVAVAFDVWGMDEGGLYLYAMFGTLEDVIGCVERYLELEFTDWQSGGYPEKPAETGSEASHERFKRALRQGSVKLPPAAQFTVGGSYWQSYLPPSSGYPRWK